MNIINVFSPYFFAVIWIASIFFVVLFALAEIIHSEKIPAPGQWIIYICFILIFLIPVIFTLTDTWIRKNPDKKWKNKIKNVKCAIVLGFGFERGNSGKIVAGNSNNFLLKWTLLNTKARVLLIQEGIFAGLAFINKKNINLKKVKLYKIHSHQENNYINTINAAICALEKMESLGQAKAVIITHDLQLKRAAWIFNRLKKTKTGWKDFEFIIPKIPKTPFPKYSMQFHTRFETLYRFIEVFWLRPRDYIRSLCGLLPKKCPAPSNDCSNHNNTNVR